MPPWSEVRIALDSRSNSGHSRSSSTGPTGSTATKSAASLTYVWLPSDGRHTVTPGAGPSKLIRNRTQLASPEAAIPDTGPGAPAPDTSQLPSWNPSTSHSVAGGPPSATGSTVESLGVDDGAPDPQSAVWGETRR